LTTNITLVGTVLQQTNVTTFQPVTQIAAVGFPLSGTITTNFNYVPNAPIGASRDTVLTWNVGGQVFVTHRWLGSSWQAGTPTLGVGEAMFLVPNQATTWTNGFSVQ